MSRKDFFCLVFLLSRRLRLEKKIKPSRVNCYNYSSDTDIFYSKDYSEAM